MKAKKYKSNNVANYNHTLVWYVKTIRKEKFDVINPILFVNFWNGSHNVSNTFSVYSIWGIHIISIR